MTAVDGPAGLRGIALAGTALMLIVVIASAYLRLATQTLGCPDATACVSVQGTVTTIGPAMAFARFAHRVAATGVGLVLIAAVVVVARHRPRDLRLLTYALAAITLVGVLAGVGARSAEAASGIRTPGVAFVNVAGGLALLGLVWRLAQDRSRLTGTDSPRKTLAARVALIAVAGWTATDAAVATGLSSLLFDATLGARHQGNAWLGLAVIAGATSAIGLLRSGHTAQRLGASIIILVTAAVAARVIAGYTPGIASGLAITVIAALLICALVSAASSGRSTAPSVIAAR